MKLIQALGLEDDNAIASGQSDLMDERDIDFLDHLEVPMADDIAVEGLIGAVLKEVPDLIHNSVTETKGWFKGIETKRAYISDTADAVIVWLKDKDADNRNLDLDMGTFKTWLKTSAAFMWRFYFLLDDGTWSKIKSNLKAGEITSLESMFNADLTKRQEVTNKLDSINDIKGLIKVIETYKQRSNEFFELILKRQIKVKSFPFQVILLGLVDLRMTVKRIVNLAL